MKKWKEEEEGGRDERREEGRQSEEPEEYASSSVTASYEKQLSAVPHVLCLWNTVLAPQLTIPSRSDLWILHFLEKPHP